MGPIPARPRRFTSGRWPTWIASERSNSSRRTRTSCPARGARRGSAPGSCSSRPWKASRSPERWSVSHRCTTWSSRDEHHRRGSARGEHDPVFQNRRDLLRPRGSRRRRPHTSNERGTNASASRASSEAPLVRWWWAWMLRWRGTAGDAARARDLRPRRSVVFVSSASGRRLTDRLRDRRPFDVESRSLLAARAACPWPDTRRPSRRRSAVSAHGSGRAARHAPAPWGLSLSESPADCHGIDGAMIRRQYGD